MQKSIGLYRSEDRERKYIILREGRRNKVKIKKAIKNIEDTYNCHSNDRACNNKERMEIEKEKNEIIEMLQGIGEYPEIEKIFIDFDRYCHSIEIGEEARKMNPLQSKYIDGYKECYNDIRDRIRELIKSKTTKKDRIFKCDKCGFTFNVPWNIVKVNCPCGNTGYSESI